MRLVFDAANLAHRMFFAIPPMAHKDRPTNAIFGFLRAVAGLMEEFSTRKVAFAFDRRPYLRNNILPGYKERIKVQPALHKKNPDDVKWQLQELHDKILPALGFKNVWSADGYEADDIIAQALKDHPGQYLVVSNDRDLWQCLSDRVEVYDPQKKDIFTPAKLMKCFGVRPDQWAMVKAIAGCKTDSVPGVKNCRDILASQYVRGDLKSHLAAYARIFTAGKMIERNLKLVKLPFAGTPSFRFKKNDLSRDRWQRVFKEYGINLKVADG